MHATGISRHFICDPPCQCLSTAPATSPHLLRCTPTPLAGGGQGGTGLDAQEASGAADPSVVLGNVAMAHLVETLQASRLLKQWQQRSAKVRAGSHTRAPW